MRGPTRVNAAVDIKPNLVAKWFLCRCLSDRAARMADQVPLTFGSVQSRFVEPSKQFFNNYSQPISRSVYLTAFYVVWVPEVLE